jgi:cytochrome P450
MRPIYAKTPPPNVRWALDVLSLRKFFANDPADALNRPCVFAVDGETTMTDEELIALHHLGKLTRDGVREFAAERRALMSTFSRRRVTALRPIVRAHAPKRGKALN